MLELSKVQYWEWLMGMMSVELSERWKEKKKEFRMVQSLAHTSVQKKEVRTDNYYLVHLWVPKRAHLSEQLLEFYSVLW